MPDETGTGPGVAPRRRGMVALAAGCAAAIWTMSAPSEAAARPARPLIRLSCPADTPEAQALCRAMIQSLAQAAPGYVIRRVPAGEETPGRTGDVGIALVIEETGAHGIGGHLEWQPGTGAARHQSPTVRLNVQDALLAPRMLGRFTDGLVAADPDLRATLGRTPQN